MTKKQRNSAKSMARKLKTKLFRNRSRAIDERRYALRTCLDLQILEARENMAQTIDDLLEWHSENAGIDGKPLTLELARELIENKMVYIATMVFNETLYATEGALHGRMESDIK